MLLEVLKTFLITSLVFLPLEHFLPRNKQSIFRDKWVTDLLYVFGAVFLISALTTGILITGVIIFDPLVTDAVKPWVSSQPIFLQLIAIMVIADLGYYLMHRLHHEIPFLWKFHAVHHSIEEMDWLAAYRTHPFDQSLTRGVSLIPIVVLGFSSSAFALWGVFFMWHALLKHSNVRIGFGPLRYILMEPVFHHWHHANEKHAFDHNYAGQLPFWDILFGTAIMENRFGPSKYGTDTYVPDDIVGQILHPVKSALVGDKADSVPEHSGREIEAAE